MRCDLAFLSMTLDPNMKARDALDPIQFNHNLILSSLAQVVIGAVAGAAIFGDESRDPKEHRQLGDCVGGRLKEGPGN